MSQIRNARHVRTLILICVVGIVIVSGLHFVLLTAMAAPSIQEAPLAAGSDIWRTPRNLSQSGAASEPRMAVDAAGVTHVIWREEAVNRMFYTHTGDGSTEVWNEPVALELPFATRRYAIELRPEQPTPLFTPDLVADSNGRVHAFWLDDRNAFFHSSVPAEEFENFASWTPRQQLADSALALNATVDDQGILHLIYIRNFDSAEGPAGIYYRQLDPNLTWSTPEVLYASAYYRALPPEEANIDIVAGSTVTTTVETDVTDEAANSATLVATWDNRSLEQVFAGFSPDRGASWFEPRVMDERQPEDIPQALGPSGIDVIALGNQIHVTWLAGHGTNYCQQYHQWSNNGGLSWEQRTTILGDRLNCPTDSNLLVGENDLLLLLTYLGQDAYMQAWNGEVWSEPERQLLLTTFDDPTTRRAVDLGCQETAVGAQNNLLVVGCTNIGENTGRETDIWLLERPLGTINTWFPPQQIWSEPEMLGQLPAALKTITIVADTGVEVDSDENENIFFHLFYYLEDSPEIFYSRWNGVRWSPPRVIQTTLGGPVGALSITLDESVEDQSNDGENADDEGANDENNKSQLLLTWSDAHSGELFFTRANSQEAVATNGWSTPVLLPARSSVASSPSIVADHADGVAVAYAVAANEQRGIYITQTQLEAQSGGESEETWREPLQVFDAEAVGWDFVDNPRLVLAPDGQFHLLFTRYLINASGAVPQELYYTFSGDGGQTWTPTALVREGPIVWSKIVVTGSTTVHRMWQEVQNGRVGLWHQISQDSGVTWSEVQRIGNSIQNPSIPGLTVDQNGHLHLLRQEGEFVRHWVWTDGEWERLDEFLNLRIGNETTLTGAGAEMLPDGRLGLAFAATTLDQETREETLALYFAGRMWELGQPAEEARPAPQVALSTLLPEQTAEPEPTAAPAATDGATAVAVQNNASLEETNAGGGAEIAPPPASNIARNLMVGLMPVIIGILAIVAFFGLRKTRTR